MSTALEEREEKIKRVQWRTHAGVMHPCENPRNLPDLLWFAWQRAVLPERLCREMELWAPFLACSSTWRSKIGAEPCALRLTWKGHCTRRGEWGADSETDQKTILNRCAHASHKQTFPTCTQPECIFLLKLTKYVVYLLICSCQQKMGLKLWISKVRNIHLK